MSKLGTRHGLIDLEALPLVTLSAHHLATTLSRINRYAGNAPVTWNVAAHSVLVSRLCDHPEEQAWALLHDAHEAFLGDFISPAIEFVASNARTGAIGLEIEFAVAAAKAKLDRQIMRAWGLADGISGGNKIDFEQVAHYDRIALEAEMFVFFGTQPSLDPGGDLIHAIQFLNEHQTLSCWASATQAWIEDVKKLDDAGFCSAPLIATETAA